MPPLAMKVAIFDDVLAARREVFHIPGLDIAVYGDADDVQSVCGGADPPSVLCMDYAMGPQHANGADAVAAVRAAGYRGRIVAMSSDPAANARMIAAGADEQIQQKAMLRSYLVALGKKALGEAGMVRLQVVGAVAAVAMVAGGMALAGPYGHESRWQGDLVKVKGRVLADGAVPSQLDGAPVAVEAVAVWGVPNRYEKKDDYRFDRVAGDETPRDADLWVAADGAKVRVRAGRTAEWHLSDGAARRLAYPGQVKVGEGLAGLRNGAYVAKSRRVLVGDHIVIVGTRDPSSGVVYASLIADEAHGDAAGRDTREAQPAYGAGLGMVALGLGGAALLALRW